MPNALETFFKAKGFSFRSFDGRHRIEGFADPDSGIKVITATGLPPCYITSGEYHQGDHGHSRPRRVVSVASGFNATFEQVVRLVCDDSYSAMGRSLQADFQNYRPQMRPFFAARDGDKEALEATGGAAIRKVLRLDHDCTVELCRIRALDRGMAADWIRENDDVPYKRVQVTPQSELVDPNWYMPEVSEVQRIPDIDDPEQLERTKEGDTDHVIKQLKRQRMVR